MTTELHVFMEGRRIGALTRKSRQNVELSYEERLDEGTTPLSVSLPVRAAHHSSSTVVPYLWGLLPDNERVIERWARDYTCSATDVFALLANVGTDVAGAAQYLPPGIEPEHVRPGRIEQIPLKDVAELLRRVRKDTTSWHPSAALGRWSLAGAQGKLALTCDGRTGSWGTPSGAVPTTHILKPAIEGLTDHDINEHLCLATAQRLDLPAAQTSVSRFGDERALVVERYDRVAHADGQVGRTHQEDFCQALSVHPSHKYQSDGGPGMEQMADLLWEVIADSPQRQVEVLCKAAAFNWLTLATDAHAKNYSLLLSGSQVRLAPLYDIASALPYGEHPRKLKLAMKIGGEYRAIRIEQRHWQRLALSARISSESLCSQILGMIDRLPDAMSDAINATELLDDERKWAIKLHNQLTDWLTHCRIAMTSQG